MNRTFRRPTLKGQKTLLSTINVTPFVDVVLVLLVIFMITIQPLSNALKMHLPKVTTEPVHDDNKVHKLTIKIDNNNYISIGHKTFKLNELEAYLKHFNSQSADGKIQVYVAAEVHSYYDTIAKILALLGKNGYSSIALLTKPPHQDKHNTN